MVLKRISAAILHATLTGKLSTFNRKLFRKNINNIIFVPNAKGMKQIEQIYFNDFGMAFYWLEQNTVMLDKIQLVFKETGFYFNVDELKSFVKLIEESCKRNTCEHCEMKNHCAKFLLKTPISQIDLAVSMKELDGIKDLVQGTLFKVSLQEYIFGVGMN